MALVSVKVTPGSHRPGIALTPTGIAARVTARAREGAANDAVRRALARALGVSLATVRLKRGATSRTKLFEVDGLDMGEVLARLRTP